LLLHVGLREKSLREKRGVRGRKILFSPLSSLFLPHVPSLMRTNTERRLERERRGRGRANTQTHTHIHTKQKKKKEGSAHRWREGEKSEYGGHLCTPLSFPRCSLSPLLALLLFSLPSPLSSLLSLFSLSSLFFVCTSHSMQLLHSATELFLCLLTLNSARVSSRRALFHSRPRNRGRGDGREKRRRARRGEREQRGKERGVQRWPPYSLFSPSLHLCALNCIDVLFGGVGEARCSWQDGGARVFGVPCLAACFFLFSFFFFLPWRAAIAR